MRPRDLAALQFDEVRNRLAECAGSPAGKAACRGLEPSADREEVARALAATWQALRLIEQHGPPPLSEFPDIRPLLRPAVHEGFVLDGASLLAIRTVLATAQRTCAFLKKHAGAFAGLADLPERLTPLPALQASLTRAIDEHGEVTDEASDELADLRRTLRQLREKLTRRLDELVARPGMADVVADRFVTLRNNRFVVPIKTAVAGQFDGVVQDRSISGETLFIEPLFAVALNNRLLVAAKEEEQLVRRILADLTALVRAEHDTLSAGFAALVDIDALFARATFAQRYGCTQPVLDDEEIALHQARHPLLLFGARPVTPVEVLMPRGKRVLVITGPNTGGKTVALKTAGLLALMAQSGMLIPAAEGSRLPCFRAIYTDVGDAQSIERNLSTFSAHVANLTEIIGPAVGGGAAGPLPGGSLDGAKSGGLLVLLDEPGVGTDPDEGAALGIGMIRVLEAAGARIIVSTHYSAIKLFALSDDRCATAAVDFDVAQLLPRYRLVYHSIGESLALPIARRLGLPAAVLAAAQDAISEHAKSLAAAMQRLEDSRRRYESRVDDADAQARAAAVARAAAERLLEELREKRRRRWADELHAARDFVRTLREQGRELLAAIERGAADRRALTRFVQQQETAIAEHAAAVAEPVAAGRPPQVGDQVEVPDTGIRGQLLSIDGTRAWIQRGSLRFEVPATGLRSIGPSAGAPVEVRVAAVSDDTPHEISLLGLRVKEAVAQLEGFLDHAVRAGYPSVRIVHGIGSGALQRAVSDYLSTSPYCAGCRAGEPREGGAGVTIAELAIR